MCLCVGETVRLSRPEAPKTKGTATIATIQAEDKTACVIWEPLAPQPLPPLLDAKLNKRRLKRPFLVAPLINRSSGDDEETETTTDLSSLMPLLDFEDRDISSEISVGAWKDRGDQLLRLGDASKACSYYEKALQLSSILQVGATVIVKVGGHAKLADVDCLEDDDDDAIEISMCDSGEEKVIKEAEVLFCILYNDDEDHLQERILLNLGRCLLQLADLARHQNMASERRPMYLRSAVLATTLAMTIAEHHSKDHQNDNSKTMTLTKFAQTALLLRAQAQAGLGKYQNAITDTKKLLQVVPDHKEGIKQMKRLQNEQQKQKQVDKKLVKSMCSWVQKATNDDTVSDDAVRESTQPTTVGTPQITAGATTQNVTNTSSSSCTLETTTVAPTATNLMSSHMLVIYVILPLIVAFFLQQIHHG